MSHDIFRTVVLPLKNKLFRVALCITQNRHDAEDIVQETMLRVWSRREQWDAIESMEAFCLTICRNLALDREKRMERHTGTPLDTGLHDRADRSYSADPEWQAVQRDRLQTVRELIGTLPEKQRTCLQLRDVEGKAYKDIATVMGITEQQVKTNIFRARQTIKRKFTEKDNYGL